MYDPIMRVLTVLEILQAREHVTGAELAERLEVDLRTVQRYIVRLRDLHVPIESSPGVGGSYQLRPGFRIPPLMFTEEEVFALSLGLRALHQLRLSAFAPATEGVLAKLGRVVPAGLREGIQAVEDAVVVEPNMWAVSASAESLIRAATAIRACRRVRFVYCSHSGEESAREVEPYAIIHMDGRWYLIGRCLLRQALRTFRLDRADGLELCEGTFARPENFDPRAYLRERMPFVQSDYQIDVWIEMPFEEAERFFAPWRVAIERERDGTRIRCGRDQLQLAAAMLLSLGRRIVVHQPQELKEAFRELARRAVEAVEGDTP
jgi:predicted DNA-binding transcriptional regulator YafY